MTLLTSTPFALAPAQPDMQALRAQAHAILERSAIDKRAAEAVQHPAAEASLQAQWEEHQALSVEVREQRHESRLRHWALDIVRSASGDPDELQAVRDMNMSELQAWWNEAHS